MGGSQSAFEAIVRRFERPMIGLIARMTGDPAAAEDLAQEAFVKAFRNLAAFDTTRRLSSWLFRIAHNTALDALRKPRLPVRLDGEGAARVASPGPAPSEPLEREALGRAIGDALGRVRPEYRAAIALRYTEGLPYDEIAKVLGVPEVTARTYVHRARKALARLLTEAGWAPSTPASVRPHQGGDLAGQPATRPSGPA